MNKRRRFKAKRRRRADLVFHECDWSGSVSSSVALYWDRNGECWQSIDGGPKERAPKLDWDEAEP